jgi:hypothetical protein
MKHHLNLILNQFPAREQRALLCWIQKSAWGGKIYPKSFWLLLNDLIRKSQEGEPDYRIKATFSVLKEFGNRLSPKALRYTIDEMENRRHLDPPA